MVDRSVYFACFVVVVVVVVVAVAAAAAAAVCATVKGQQWYFHDYFAGGTLY